MNQNPSCSNPLQVGDISALANELQAQEVRIQGLHGTDNRRGLMRRLFPNASQQEIDQHEQALLRRGFDYQRRALHMAVEARLQAMEEAANNALVVGGSQLRRERQEFFAEQLLALRQHMDEVAERFNGRVDERLAALDQLRSQPLRDREQKRLYNAIEQFHDLLDRLGDEFTQIIDQGVTR